MPTVTVACTIKLPSCEQLLKKPARSAIVKRGILVYILLNGYIPRTRYKVRALDGERAVHQI
jgi:hypothetical protein